MSLLHLLEEGLRIEALVFTHVDLLSRVPAGPAEPEPELVLSSSQVQLWVPLKGCLFFLNFPLRLICLIQYSAIKLHVWITNMITVAGDTRHLPSVLTVTRELIAGSIKPQPASAAGIRAIPASVLTGCWHLFWELNWFFSFFFFSPGKFHLYHNIERH